MSPAPHRRRTKHHYRHLRNQHRRPSPPPLLRHNRPHIHLLLRRSSCLPRCSCHHQWRLPQLGLQTRTIARMALRIGWRVGLWERRHGVAESMARVAQEQLVGVRLQLPTIATLASPIGWSVGLWRRRRGVASMEAKVAQERQLGVSRLCQKGYRGQIFVCGFRAGGEV